MIETILVALIVLTSEDRPVKGAQVDVEGDKVAQINSKLHLEQETILRYLIVRQRVSKVKVSGPKVLAGGQAPEVSKVKKVKVEGKAK